MDNLQIRIASNDDFDVLANLNKQLIEDEKHDNPMDVDQLRERMKGFLEGVYCAYMFELDSQIVGYSLVNKNRTPHFARVHRDTY